MMESGDRRSQEPCQLLTVKELAAALNVNERTCWRLAHQAEAGIGRFPKPLRLAPKTIRWRLSDVESYINGLAECGRKSSRN